MTKTEEDIKILERVLASYLNEYKEHADGWKSLEQKAQIAATIAGVFVAGIFAFTRQPAACYAVSIPLLVSLLSLMAVIACVAVVLKATDIDIPEDGLDIWQRASQLLDSGSAPMDEHGSRYIALLTEIVGKTKPVLGAITSANDTKALWLLRAWVALCVAMSAATVGTAVRIVGACAA